MRKSNRAGTFRISHEAVWTIGEAAGRAPERFTEMVAFMHQMFIYRAEHDWLTDCVKYWAISPLFEELEDGEKIPEYHIEYQLIRDEDDPDNCDLFSYHTQVRRYREVQQ